MFPDFPDLQGTEKRSIVVLKSVNLVTVTEIPNLKLQKSAEAKYTFRAVGRESKKLPYRLNTFSFLFECLQDSKGALTPRTERRAANRWQAEVDDLVNSKTIAINKSPLLLNAISTPWTNSVTVLSFLKALNRELKQRRF